MPQKLPKKASKVESSDDMKEDVKTDITLPLIPLRYVVIYPHMVIPLFVGRTESIKALEFAMTKDKQVVLVAQKNASVDVPTEKDLFSVGTAATILQMLRLPDGTVKVLVEGVSRAQIVNFSANENFMQAQLKLYQEPEKTDDSEVTVLMRNVTAQFERLVKANKKIPPDLITSVRNMKLPAHFADSVEI